MIDFLLMVERMHDVGITGAKQQYVIYLLWSNGPMRWSQIHKELPMAWRGLNPQMHTLINKSLVTKTKSRVNGRVEAKYTLNPEIAKHIDQ